jgi:hypothetical protein
MYNKFLYDKRTREETQAKRNRKILERYRERRVKIDAELV